MAQPGWRSYLARLLGWLRWTPAEAAEVVTGTIDFVDATTRIAYTDTTETVAHVEATQRIRYHQS